MPVQLYDMRVYGSRPVSSLSTEFIYIKLNLNRVWLEEYVRPAIDNTTPRVAIMAPSDGVPTDADWLDAEWQADVESFFVRCLVGPRGAKTLAPGDYTVWVRINDAPQDIILSTEKSGDPKYPGPKLTVY